MGKVLVLGNDSRAFLSVIRSLGRGGLDVHAAWHSPDSVARRSTYLRRSHALPPYDEQDGSWKSALIELMCRERFDLVVPCSDSIVVAFQRHRAELKAHGRPYLISDQAYEILYDKVKTNELARSVGVPLPREVVVTDPEEARSALDRFGLPIVLKPHRSHNPDDPSSKLLVRKVYSEEAFKEMLTDMVKSGPVAVQENFLGRGVGVEMLLRDGRPVLQFQHLRVHEPLHGGGSSYRKSVPVSPELLEASLALLRPLAYTGVAMVEFKMNPDTREWVLIEVNARFWGSLPLAIAAGVDFPLSLYQLLVEGRDSFPQGYRPNVYCRNLLMDLAWQRANLQADRSDPTLATRPIGRVIRDAITNVVTFRERLDTFTLDDPVPGLVELRQVVSKVGIALRRAVAKRWLTLGLVRQRRMCRASEAVKRAERVLFVCKGNICRSAFAEHLAHKRGLFASVVSSGYYPAVGRPSPEKAVDAAKDWGVDLKPHRSERLAEEQLREADVVLVFDFENYCEVAAAFPFARPRLHYAGSLSVNGPLFIQDPWGKAPDHFSRVFAEIEATLTVAAKIREHIPSIAD